MAHGGEGLSPAGWDIALGPASPELVREKGPQPGLRITGPELLDQLVFDL
jgi:hypothetical protein